MVFSVHTRNSIDMSTDNKIEKFELITFVYQNALEILVFFAFIKIMFPVVWEAQISASWQLLLTTFLVTHLFMAFVEFFFHRYALHTNAIPLFSHFHKQHNLHHGLTAVARDPLYVRNEYPIVEEEQHEASFFPWYTFLLFSALFTPFFILAHFMLPGIPVFIAGYTGLMFSMVLYEFIHNTWHMSLTTWHRLFKQKFFGNIWKTIYTFHLRHHADVRCNESVSGFFGIPIPDILFGTYVYTGTLYPHKQIVSDHEFISPQPIFFIRWLDAFFKKLST